MSKQTARTKCTVAALVLTAFVIAPARAQQAIVDTVAQGCAKELQSYCRDVTAGDGRIAFCLYAYEDKLSLNCAVAVYNAVVDFQIATANIEIYAKKCSSDLLQYCGTIAPGGGRLYQCLAKNKATLTPDCTSAMKKGEPELRRLGIIQ